MEKLLERIESYQLINYLIPGIIFASILSFLIDENIYSPDGIIAGFQYYFTGMVLSRVGSIILDPFLEKFGIIKKESYGKFVKGEKVDEKVNVIQREANQYRTFITAFVSLLIIEIYNCFTVDCSKSIYIIYFIALSILFVLAYKKQMQYVVERIVKEE